MVQFKKSFIKPSKIQKTDNLFSIEKGFGASKPEAIRLIKKVISIFDDFGLNYCLISGTLLGYARHRDFIPWDDDIDLLVERRIFDILPDIAAKYKKINLFSKKNYDVIKACFKNGTPILKDRFKWGEHALSEGAYCWPFIDIFPYDVQDQDIKFFRRTWAKNHFFPSKKVEFLGIPKVSIPNNADYFLKLNYGKNYMTEFISSNHSHKTDMPNKETATLASDDFRSLLNSGVDVKILQYSEHALERSEDQIDLKELIDTYLIKKKSKGTNCVLINLEKDVERYNNAVDELKKVSFTNFVHLKGTYWKNRQQFETDLTFVKDFLSNFNKDVYREPIKIDEFSTLNDPNIHIQDGPLACLCSHMRGIIYGYLNFEDYTIIVEDDICVTNTKNISEYLKQVPDDWDIVCFNSRPKKDIPKSLFYKFTSDWHSTHFYIINHKCLPFLFKHLYPITDQIDVLISDQTQKLNIYNIVDTVYQKNIATNTQNNLHVIFNSPHYSVVRAAICRIENLCEYFINRILPNNEEKNRSLVIKLMYDVLYNYITRSDVASLPNSNKEDYQFDSSDLKGEEYEDLLAALEFFLQCTKKGIVPRQTAEHMANTILFTISKFKEFHNTIDPKFGLLQAYDFGSSAHVYFAPEHNVIVKQYNQKLRWIAPEHESSREVFDKEVDLLQYLNLISFDKEKMRICMRYWGESLYRDFNLPGYWRFQLKSLFQDLNELGINYPEFRLQNITVLYNQLHFVDYGLASRSNVDNEENYKRFVSILEKCEQKFEGKDQRKIVELYSTLERNLGL